MIGNYATKLGLEKTAITSPEGEKTANREFEWVRIVAELIKALRNLATIRDSGVLEIRNTY